MSFVHIVLVGVVATVMPLAAMAQFVKGNEAVRVLANGTTKVETPPIPTTGPAARSKVCAAAAGCHPGPWHMVETSTGLRECTEPFARETACRASTVGSQKLSRVWVAKRGSNWLWCQYPDLGSKCVDMNARPPLNLPVSAVQ
jgi:hypothetical protein